MREREGGGEGAARARAFAHSLSLSHTHSLSSRSHPRSRGCPVREMAGRSWEELCKQSNSLVAGVRANTRDNGWEI